MASNAAPRAGSATTPDSPRDRQREVRELIEAGDRALAALDDVPAAAAYRRVLALDPANTHAVNGLQSARRLPGLRAVVVDARTAEAGGNLGRALTGYSQALAVDSGNANVRAAYDRLQQRLARDAFGRAMGQGYAALGAGKLDAANEAFGEALRMRPDAESAIRAIAETTAAIAARENASRQRVTAGR